MDFFSKRRIFGAFCILGALYLLSVFIHACTDFGLEADFLKGTIKGTLRLNAVPPDTTDDIQVALVKEFPATNFAELLLSGNLFNRKDTTEVDSYSFEFEVPLEEFDALVAVWKAKATPWNIFRNVIGVYCKDQGELKNIVLSDTQRVVEGIEFQANLLKVNRTAKLKGQIEFKGEWPGNLENLALVVTKSITIGVCELPDIDIILLPKEPVERLNYEIDIAPGNYAVVIVWQQGGAGLLEFKKIGLSSEFVIEDKSTISDFNILADFDNPF